MHETIRAVKALDIDEATRAELVSQLQAHDDDRSQLQMQVDDLQNKLDDWEQGFTGKEAEELRMGIEKAVELLGDSDAYGYDCEERAEEVRDRLARLLDKVDARDSLRFLEERQDRLAALYHAQWSGWVNYLFQKATDNEDGSVTLPREFVTQWSRQSTLLWGEMTHKERASAREAASKIVEVLRG